MWFQIKKLSVINEENLTWQEWQGGPYWDRWFTFTASIFTLKWNICKFSPQHHHRHQCDRHHPPTGYTRSYPASPGCGSDQAREKAKKRSDRMRKLWWLSIGQKMKSGSPENESGVWGKLNLSHLVQHEPLKPLSQSATEWVVELQCHGGGALGKDKSCQINSDWCCQTWKT